MKIGRSNRGKETANPLSDRDIMDIDPSPLAGAASPLAGSDDAENSVREQDHDGAESEIADAADYDPDTRSEEGSASPTRGRRRGRPVSEVGETFLGMPLFTPRSLRVYFTLILAINVAMLAFMWFIQIELQAGDSYTAALIFGGGLVGLQLSNFGDHWKASQKGHASWMTAQTVRGHVLRWERQKWHTKMIFYPIMVLIVLTLIYNFGVYTLVIHFTGETGKCPTGILDGISMFDDAGNGLLLLGGFTAMFVGMLVFMSLLSIAHFKQYMRLYLFRIANPMQPEPGDDDDSNRVGLNSGLFRARFIRRTYLASVTAQGLILVALSVGKEATTEPNLLYSLLMFGIFLLGWQVGVGERHLHFDASVEPSADDDSIIRDRIEWHSSMMFYPCAVCIAQCFYNFSALFTLLPYFATSCDAQTIGEVMGGLSSTGWLIFVSNSCLFCVAMASLIFLCLLHFVQFQRFQLLLGT